MFLLIRTPQLHNKEKKNKYSIKAREEPRHATDKTEVYQAPSKKSTEG